MSENICPVCTKGQLVEREGPFETKYSDKKGLEHALRLENVRRLACNKCGEEILDDAASGQIESARRAAMGLLSPAQIRDLRYRFGKTQTQMSRLLGVGEKTYCRWESGSFIQSAAFDNYLRLLRDVPEATAMLIRLERGESAEAVASDHESNSEFTFLKNIGAAVESSAKFTRLMVFGMLHISDERITQSEA
jgi:putative zinc finger/helix-turn-helix YgiT family protein